MRFNYSTTPAHPRKVFTIINKFINDNVYLERTVEGFPAGMSIEEFHRRLETRDFDHWQEQTTFRIKKGEMNAAWNCHDEHDTDCLITINFEETGEEGATAVYYDAIQRCPELRGFSRLTFAILHEVGHFMTGLEEEACVEIPEMTEEEKIELMGKAFSQAHNWKEFERIIQAEYVSQPAEKLATDWALDFLRNPENRKKTKAFEREFFKAWRG